MIRFQRRVSLFLFASGFCALVYQLGWLRELRLVFGSSTNASAAVLAIFMGGLGLGGYLLGGRAERSANPLALYARLELGVALAAAASVPLIATARWIYLAAGGTRALGPLGGTLLRLALAVVVLGLPTFLMGGTLPAAVRTLTRVRDTGRQAVGWLYAINTLGAVAGALAATFLLIELVGIRQTLWLAALLNILVAVAARSTARAQGAIEPIEPDADAAAVDVDDSVPERPPLAAPRLVLAAAFLVGFVFFLMELVWYRMLAPILGGSTYTFGIILVVALAGIGAGGLAYGLTGGARRPGPRRFALTCLIEALAVALPFALGDRVAFLALELRDLQAAGFAALAAGWGAVAALVVLPAALVAGYQFPLLVALLGSGRRRVARQVGLAYAWNTAGAIAGSVAGGFGLIPLLSAPTVWRLSTWLLLALGLVFLVHRGGLRGPGRLLPAAVGLAALAASAAVGPTAFWRHGGIGAGRMAAAPESPNELRDLRHGERRAVEWEADGRESSVALMRDAGYAFFINGKSDGSARGDAPTQVMSGLVGAALHPRAERALVIGLGTGSSAGWMAGVESIERVDVVELEPLIRRVAEDCAPVNRNALEDPKIEVVYADGREFLLTTDTRYDVIFSEPSNPYRAGISSLFTSEFYRAARRGLTEDGIFVQWLQAYEIDAQVARTAYATLHSVFPYVETWQVQPGDLLLVASVEPIVHDLPAIAARLEGEPFAGAMAAVWGVSGATGFYTGFVASPEFAAAVAVAEAGAINTDDHPVIEFGFARHVGRKGSFSVRELRRLAVDRGEHRPGLAGGELDWERVESLRGGRAVLLEAALRRSDGAPGERRRDAARAAYLRGNLGEALRWWPEPDALPESRGDLSLLAEALAEAGDDRAAAVIERLAAWSATEAEAVRARWHLRQGRPVEAVAALESAFARYRVDPWPQIKLMARSLELAQELGAADPALARRLWEALGDPFVVRLVDETRLLIRIDLARSDYPALCAASLAPFEPWPPWKEGFLRLRRDCYRATGHRLAAAAQRDLESFYGRGETLLWHGLVPEERVEPSAIDLPDGDDSGRGR